MRRHSFATPALVLIAVLLPAACSSFSGSDAPLAGDDASSDGATETIANPPPTDGGSDVVDAKGPACTNAFPFRDDFEGRTGLKGCWDMLTTSGGIAAMSKGELGTLPGATGRGFHVTLVPPDGGGSGAVYLSKIVKPVPAPARLTFKWFAESFPNGGDGQNGLFAVELVYQYKDPGGFLKVGSTSVAFGVNGRTINPYLAGESYLPADAVESGSLWESALELGTTQVSLQTNALGTTVRTSSLPSGMEFAVTAIKIGVTNVGSVAADWSLYFDDVLLDVQ